MAPQTPIDAFKPEVQEACQQYLNILNKTGKLLMNATRRALYLQFLYDPDQKTVELDKYEKSRFFPENLQAINEFCFDNSGQLLHVGLRKKDITRPKAFFYDAFDIITRIHGTERHNRYKKKDQRVKNESYGISRDKVQWLLEDCQVWMVNCQNNICAYWQHIVALDVHKRVQADFIDMRNKPKISYV